MSPLLAFGKSSFSALALLLTSVLMSPVWGAETGPIKKLTVDPKAPEVELFQGIDDGQLEARLTAVNQFEGRVFITNKTDRPLTVTVPKAVVGVHILPQNNGFNPFGVGNNANNGNPNGNANNNNGAAQSVGGNLNPAGNGNANGNGNAFGNGNGNGAMNGLGMGFFSIPAEKTVELRLNSVCLNHGRPDPHSAMTYRLMKVEEYTTDPVLQQLLEDGSPGTDRDVQQAAVWNVANNLDWKRLAQLTERRAIGPGRNLFSRKQLDAAKKLVEQSQTKAADRKPQAPTSPGVASANSTVETVAKK